MADEGSTGDRQGGLSENPSPDASTRPQGHASVGVADPRHADASAVPIEIPDDLTPLEHELLADLFAIISEHADEAAMPIDRSRVIDAFVFSCEHHADQRRKSGEEFITHPVGVAKICAGMRLDTATLCAALLHDTVEDTSASLPEVQGEFDEEIATLGQVF